MNKVVLVGRLTRDPEVRVFSNGNPVANFTLAINRNFKNKDGNIDADFIPVAVYGRQADVIQKYVTKGSQLGVDGRIQVRSYDAQDGTKRYTTDVAVESFEFIGSANDGGSNSYSRNSDNSTWGAPTEGPDMGFGDMTPVDDGDMPF